MKKKTLKLILISIAVLLILGWFLLPVLVKNYVVKNSKELLGRQINIDGLSLNLFTGNLHTTGFEMYEQDGKTVFVSFDTLNVNIEPYQFLFNKKVVEQFYMQGLYVNIIKKDSSYNFDDLLAYHSSDNDPPAEEPEAEESFKYILSNLELKDANFVFEDKNLDHTTNIEDFSFFIPQISWDQEQKSNADLRFNFKRGGYLESSLNINPVDGEFDAKINVYHMYLDPFLKRFQEYADISTVKGLLDTELYIKGNVNEAEKSLVSGRMELQDFAMTDDTSRDFLHAKKVVCTLEEIDTYNSSYRIDSLSFSAPYILFELDSTSNNLLRIFKMDSYDFETTESDNPQDSIAQSRLFYAINHLGINSGTLDYTDNLTGQPFNYHLSEVLIKTDSIFSNSDWIEINADMLLNNRGTLKAQFGYDPIGMLDGELNISVEKFLLPDLNIYTKHYIGHTMVEGDMFYYSDSKVTNGSITSENKLLIKQPTVNNTKGGLFALPLKIALWLLKDKNGDVNLNVPVRGDLNDPEIDVWKLVWSTLRNKITDTADNPVSSLAPLVGADPKELISIDFNFADTLLTNQHVKQLNWLVELEKKKEGLSIDLNYFVDDQLQTESINAMHMKPDSVRTDAAMAAEVEGSFDQSLSDRYYEARMRSIKKTLDSLYPDTRINTVGRDSLSPENTGASPTFKIKFSLDSLN